MLKIREAVIVEGRYDKIKLSNLIDAPIIETNGFRVFKDREKQSLIRQIAKTRGQIKHCYIPQIEGKEKRKPQKSKEGLLGVEGVTDEVIIRAVKKSGATIIGEENTPEQQITKADLYMLGLTGTENSAKLRLALLKKLDMPSYLSTNAMLAALNCLYSLKELKDILNKLCS